jgi:nucleoid-associated protein YgaU
MDRAPSRDKFTWLIMIGLILIAVGGATAVYWGWPVSGRLATTLGDANRSPGSRPEPRVAAALPTPTAAPAPSTPQAAPPQPAAPPAPVVPTFDIVRVTPQGNAVVAGRAEPFARVIVHDGDRVLGETQADRNGEFVIVPERPVAPGGRELTLTARGTDGREVQGQDSVIVMVGPPPTEPAPSDAKPTVTATIEPPVAVLLPHDDTAPRILQSPAKTQGLALNSVDYNQQGDIRFSGSAKPSAPVRVYVDNKPVGETSTDHGGQWTLTPLASMQPGVHQLRVDEIDASGQVQHRVELPFQRTAAPVAGLSPGQMVVQPGSNLWRIARQTYGAGARYTVIYLANREQIRDPNRIYPGQVFSVPGE